MISVRFKNSELDRYGKLNPIIAYLREIIGTSISAIEYENRMNEGGTYAAKRQLGSTTMERLCDLYNKAGEQEAFNPTFTYRNQVVYKLDQVLTQSYFGTVFKIAELSEDKGQTLRVDTTFSRYEYLLDDIENYLDDAIITTTYTENDINILKLNVMPGIREVIKRKQLRKKTTSFTFSARKLLETVFAHECEEEDHVENFWFPDGYYLYVTNVEIIHKYFNRMFTIIGRCNDNCRKHIDMEHLLNIGIVCLLYKIASIRKQQLYNLLRGDLAKVA